MESQNGETWEVPVGGPSEARSICPCLGTGVWGGGRISGNRWDGGGKDSGLRVPGWGRGIQKPGEIQGWGRGLA